MKRWGFTGKNPREQRNLAHAEEESPQLLVTEIPSQGGEKDRTSAISNSRRSRICLELLSIN